jgi:hypothetical protein
MLVCPCRRQRDQQAAVVGIVRTRNQWPTEYVLYDRAFVLLFSSRTGVALPDLPSVLSSIIDAREYMTAASTSQGTRRNRLLFSRTDTCLRLLFAQRTFPWVLGWRGCGCRQRCP